MSLESPYTPPKSDLGKAAPIGSIKKIMFSFIAIFVGFLIIDFGSLFFRRVIAAGMGWSARSGDEVNMDVALIRLSFSFLMYIVSGYVSYRIAKVGKIWHPVALVVIMYFLWFAIGGNRTYPIWFNILGAAAVLVGLVGGGFIGAKLDGYKEKNHNKRMQTEHQKAAPFDGG